MKTVAADGGEVHYEEVADEAGYSVSQVYRALEEIGDLVVNDNGLVRFYSEKIKQEITGIVERIEDFLEEGLSAWMDAGRDPAAFAQLRFEAEEILGRQRDDGFVGRTITW